MLENTRRMIEEIDKIKAICIKEMCNPDVLMSTDGNTLEIMLESMNLIEISKNLMIAQATMMEDMNKKLDILVNKKEQEA